MDWEYCPVFYLSEHRNDNDATTRIDFREWNCCAWFLGQFQQHEALLVLLCEVPWLHYLVSFAFNNMINTMSIKTDFTFYIVHNSTNINKTNNVTALHNFFIHEKNNDNFKDTEILRDTVQFNIIVQTGPIQCFYTVHCRCRCS